jgi:cytochrome c biogenesis protein CcmG/thiol:disulfide interchange protein DsbE
VATLLTPGRALALAFLLAAGGVVVALVASAQRPTGVGPIEVSGPMPPIEEPSINDMGRVSPSLYRDKIVLVNFWASWCGPCRKEQPALSRLWEEYRDRGVRFLGVDFKDDRAAGLAYLDEFEVAYPSVEDPTGIIAHRFGVPYLPATVLVGADGEMRLRLVGAQTEEALRRHLEDLLAESA